MTAREENSKFQMKVPEADLILVQIKIKQTALSFRKNQILQNKYL